MRLIYADALNELLEHHERTLHYNVKHGNSNKSRDFIMGVEDGYYRVQSDIKWIPTVDAVEVVRCRDCKFCEDTRFFNTSAKVCRWWEKLTDAEGFCHAAKKRGEEDEIKTL